MIRTALRRLALACAALSAVVGPAVAQTVPPFEPVAGHAFGAGITRSADVRAWFDALAAADPARVRIGEYARTWEGRPLFWVAIGSPGHIARLEEIKAATAALADPRRTSRARADALIADTPAVVWLAFSVHGNEISPADASIEIARRLLTDRSALLENALVVLVPTQNPDGRERFINSFEAARGLEPDPEPFSAERNEPWPAGRWNHYLFDLNRDWLVQSQPETLGHARAIRDWRPQVVVDAHEMGSDETFFFPPEAQPLNPWIFPRTLENRELFGRNTARRFDEAGQGYFTRKVYDAFYPGYGDGWPGYLGAVSLTYEQGSARGLVARRSAGETFTYADTVANHVRAGLATIETAANNRARLLADFYAYGLDGVAGRGAYLLSRAADPVAADRLAAVLNRSNIEVGRATAAFTACGRRWEAGDYVVDLAQPQRRLAETLLARETPIDPGFLAQQESRRDRGLGDEFYDVTAWSLPLMFNVPAQRCAAAPGVAVTPSTGEAVVPGTVGAADAAYGFVVEPGLGGTRFLGEALRAGLVVSTADQAITLGGRAWPSGVLILPRAGNPADLGARVAAIAGRTGAAVTGVADSWVSEGPSLGGSDVVRLRAPRIAMAWDDPTSPDAAGATRFILEREFGWPVTVVRTRSLGRADLSRHQVLILPDGGDYASVLGQSGVAALRDWVRRGGTLISLGSATRLLTAEASQMLSSRPEEPAPGTPVEDGDGPVIADEEAYAHVLAGEHGRLDYIAGALVRATVDPEHWLGAGLQPTLNVLVRGDEIYSPIGRGEGSNAVRFSGPDDLVASGLLWAENRRQLAYKPFVMTAPLGRGQLIAFTQDPTVRAYLEGLKPLLLNAVLRGPAHATPNWP